MISTSREERIVTLAFVGSSVSGPEMAYVQVTVKTLFRTHSRQQPSTTPLTSALTVYSRLKKKRLSKPC